MKIENKCGTGVKEKNGSVQVQEEPPQLQNKSGTQNCSKKEESEDFPEIPGLSEETQALLDRLPVATEVLEVLNRDHIYIRVMNQACLNVFHIDQEEYRQSYRNQMLSDVSDRKECFRISNSQLAQLYNGKTVDFEYQSRRNSGEELWLCVYCRMEFYGKKILCILSFIDITQEKADRKMLTVRREALNASRTENSLLAMAFDTTSDARIVMVGDVVPEGLSEAASLPDFITFVKNRIRPEDSIRLNNQYSHRVIREIIDGKKSRFSLDCLFKADPNSSEQPVWVSIDVMLSVNPLNDHIDLFIQIIDIDQKKKREQELLSQAGMDPLTGLPNRKEFESRFEKLPMTAVHVGKQGFAMIELDGIKQFNDLYGHPAGDQLLCRAVSIIQICLREGEPAARIGGSMFLVYIPYEKNEENLRERFRILQLALEEQIEGKQVVTVRTGVTMSDKPEDDFGSLYKKADIALRLSKQKNDAGITFYEDDRSRQQMLTLEVPSSENNEALQGEKLQETPQKPPLQKDQVFVRTFGYFDVFVNGEAILFKHAKAKELLALLIDRRGGYVSSTESISYLWENESSNKRTQARYRRVVLELKQILKNYGIIDILGAKRGSLRVVPDYFECDLYQYLSGSSEFEHLFRGSYLLNYSWGEVTASALAGPEMLKDD